MAIDEITAQLVQELQALNVFLRNQSRTGEGISTYDIPTNTEETRRNEAERLRQELASKSFESTAKELSRLYKGTQTLTGNLGSQLKYSSDLILKSIESAESLKELEKLPKQFQKALRKSTNETDQAVADSIQTIEDVLRLQARIKNLKAFKDLTAQYKETNEILPDFNERIVELGYSMEDTKKSNEELDQEIAKLAKTMGDASNDIMRSSKISEALKQSLGAFLGAGTALGKNLLTAAKAAMKYGSSVDLVDSKLLGMTNEVYSEFIASNRQTIAAMGGSQDKFNEVIEANTKRIIWFTGDLADASRATASIAKTYQMLGTETDSLSTFMKNQTKMFGKFNRAFSMTGEQFAEMNSVLTEDINVRSNIYRLNQQQRQAYFEDLQLTYESLRLKGLEHDAALRMVQTLNEMGGAKAKDRMKQAARIQAVMGAAGMAPQGARAAELLRGGLRTEAAKSEFAEIMKQANLAVGQQMQGLGGELVFGQMVEGISQFLGPTSEFVKLSQSQARAVEESTDQLAAMNDTAGDIRRVLGDTVSDNLNKIVFTTDAISTTLQEHGVAFTAMGTSLKAIATAVGTVAVSDVVGKTPLGVEAIKGTGKFLKNAGFLRWTGIGAAAFAVEQGIQAMITGQSQIANVLTDWAPDVMDAIGSKIAEIVGFSESEQKRKEEWIKNNKLQEQILEEQRKANKLAIEADRNRRQEAADLGQLNEAQIKVLRKTGYLDRPAG